MTHSTLGRLHTIKAATLVIAGTEDRIVPSRSSDVLASRIPNARLVKIEGGSHTLLAEKRGRFNREVLNFLAN
jgi:pimeloyl-ACP methyl ester carboxylesterase